MRNLKATIQYDGTNYYGFQYQRGIPTVQGTIEAAWSQVLRYPVRLFAAGRTDRGVHAEGQVINFWDSGSLPLDELHRRLLFALPEDISIVSLEEVPARFHARFSATERTYIYRIQTGASPSPFWARFSAWWLPGSYDRSALREALGVFVGKHNFWSFCGGGVPREECIRTVTLARMTEWEAGLVLELRAHSFLPRMARMIVGAALHFARGAVSLDSLKAILEHATTKFAHLAPPQGLCLASVTYPEVFR